MTQLNFQATRRKFFHFHPRSRRQRLFLRHCARMCSQETPQTQKHLLRVSSNNNNNKNMSCCSSTTKSVNNYFRISKHFIFCSFLFFFGGVTQLKRFPRCEIVFHCAHTHTHNEGVRGLSCAALEKKQDVCARLSVEYLALSVRCLSLSLRIETSQSAAIWRDLAGFGQQ